MEELEGMRKSRSKERILSLRDSNHTWDPKNQRPELWNIYNNLILMNIHLEYFHYQIGLR